MFALGPWRVFPSPKQGICFAEGEVWALESLCSFSFFLVFLFFIVMMTYGNYLHRSMLGCTEWKCWSPGSLVLDALCKQPAGFAFPFFSFFSLFPPPLFFFPLPSCLSLCFQGTPGISYTSVRKEALPSVTGSLLFLWRAPRAANFTKYLFSFSCWRSLAVPAQHFHSSPR